MFQGRSIPCQLLLLLLVDVRSFYDQSLVISDIHHHSLGEAIVGTLPVAVEKELNKTEAQLQKRGSVANRPLKRLPHRHAFMRQGDHSGPRDAFAERLSSSKVKCRGEI
jgi:hypothetical protein